MQVSLTIQSAPEARPLEFSISTSVYEMSVGIISAVAAVPVLDYLETKVCEWMTNMQFDISSLQDVVYLWEMIQGISSPIIQVATKVSFLFYVVILGPIIEEVLCRGFFNGWLKNQFIENGYDLSEPLVKALYLGIAGVFFGALHLSPFQGWANVPIFVMTSIGGVLLSMLKDEETNSLTASSWGHMTNNAIAMGQLMSKK